ncbi:ferric iron reductase, partial [Staphylococcus epidermidis]|uniref:ferric iron reductase n=1 Tax=Staphylococcus epidermidis TaxID=1282 RepID=UPI001C92BCF5
LYTQTLLTPLIPYIQNYPIPLQPHIQNTILNLPPNYKIKFIVPHLPPSPIHLNTLKHKLPQIHLTNQTLIPHTIHHVIPKFQHPLIQNHLPKFIHHFNHYNQLIQQ